MAKRETDMLKPRERNHKQLTHIAKGLGWKASSGAESVGELDKGIPNEALKPA